MTPVRMTPFRGRRPDRIDAKRRRFVRPPKTKRSGRKGEAAGNGSFEEMARSEAMAVCGTAGDEAKGFDVSVDTKTERRGK